jgi:hypothetical protein
VDGERVGNRDGKLVGTRDGNGVGRFDGENVGDSVGPGDAFPEVKNAKLSLTLKFPLR